MSNLSKSEILNCRYEDGADLEKIKEFCFQNDLTKSDLVRKAIDKFIREFPHQQKIEMLIYWLNGKPGENQMP
jgi:outer membrane protein assembly factor BamD (BamD/ComL family)